MFLTVHELTFSRYITGRVQPQHPTEQKLAKRPRSWLTDPAPGYQTERRRLLDEEDERRFLLCSLYSIFAFNNTSFHDRSYPAKLQSHTLTPDPILQQLLHPPPSPPITNRYHIPPFHPQSWTWKHIPPPTTSQPPYHPFHPTFPNIPFPHPRLHINPPTLPQHPHQNHPPLLAPPALHNLTPYNRHLNTPQR